MLYINKFLSQKILTLGVSKKTYGGMTAVLVSYEKCFEEMRFIPTWRLGNKVVKVWYAFQSTLRCFVLLLFDRKIKIVHIHGAANASFYRKVVFIKMARCFGKKVILHEHAADFREFFDQSDNKRNILQSLNLCDKLIVLSLSWKEFFEKIGVPENKIIVLNNIVFPPAIISKKQFDGKIHLLYLGEISYRKGIYDLLDTINDNKDYFKGKILLRIGGNTVDGDINAFITDNNLSAFVKYEGWVSGVMKTECLTWADVYILPSYNEGLPIAILEAMSYSHPVISTNVGGIPEVLHDYYNGILIEPGNKQQIKDAIAFFIEYPEKIQEYGNVAYHTVQPFFPESVIEQLKNIYNALLNRTL
jgi:glycosyltransferase involved in cell wall biosynthesis